MHCCNNCEKAISTKDIQGAIEAKIIIIAYSLSPFTFVEEFELDHYTKCDLCNRRIKRGWVMAVGN